MVNTPYDDVKPTPGTTGNSYEWMLDIDLGTTPATPAWKNVPDFTAFNPNPNPKLKDSTTYAHRGQTAQSKTGEDFSAQFNVMGIKDGTGEFQPELVAFIEAGDATGEDNVIPYRYYHATSGVLAYQGTASVKWSRVNTGNDDLELFQIELTGQGDRKKIPNPNKAGGGS
jgi:hypothetical protein